MKTASKYPQPHQNTREISRRARQYPHGLSAPPSQSLRRVRAGWRFVKAMAEGIAAENTRLAATLAPA